MMQTDDVCHIPKVTKIWKCKLPLFWLNQRRRINYLFIERKGDRSY